MEVTYCNRWSRHQKRPLQILGRTEAETLHKRNSPYTVLITEQGNYSCFIEINLGSPFVGVNFLDNQLRAYLEYKFEYFEEEKMFMSNSVYRNFWDDGIISKVTSYSFARDGKLFIREVEYSEEGKEKSREEKASKSLIDVSQNWEPIPTFGDYKSVSRLKR